MKGVEKCARQRQSLRLQALLLGIMLGCVAVYASARNVNELPEPSMLSLMGLGVLAAVVTWRLKGKK